MFHNLHTISFLTEKTQNWIFLKLQRKFRVNQIWKYVMALYFIFISFYCIRKFSVRIFETELLLKILNSVLKCQTSYFGSYGLIHWISEKVFFTQKKLLHKTFNFKSSYSWVAAWNFKITIRIDEYVFKSLCFENSAKFIFWEFWFETSMYRSAKQVPTQ